MSKKKVLILVLTLAFLVAGASVLYQKLADSDIPGATVNNGKGRPRQKKNIRCQTSQFIRLTAVR